MDSKIKERLIGEEGRALTSYCQLSESERKGIYPILTRTAKSALEVLEYLDTKGWVTALDISADLGIHKNTVLCLVYALAENFDIDIIPGECIPGKPGKSQTEFSLRGKLYKARHLEQK